MSVYSWSSSRTKELFPDETISVDPLQPNIGYRVPSVGGYHSRCSSAIGERDEDFFEIRPQQRKISSKNADKCHHAKIESKKATAITQLTIHPIKPIDQENIGKSNVEYKALMNSRESTKIFDRSMTAQRQRIQVETGALDKTRMLKRLAQIVPHRLDQPYYMAGSCVKLSPRYKVDDEEIEKLRIQSALRASRNTPRSSRAASRASTASARERKAERRPTRTINQSGEEKSYDNESGGANSERNQIVEEKSNENDSDGANSEKNQIDGNTSKKSEADPLFKYRGNKLITTGNFAAKANGEPSLFDGIDIDATSKDVFSDLSIVSKKQKKAFEGMFNDIDVDMNGKVTFTELMLRLFSNVSKKDAKLLMQIFDLNKDKTIDRREFIVICALNDRLCGFRTESKYDSLRLDLQRLSKQLQLYKELFSMLDQDDDDKIHIDEVMLIMTSALGKEIGMNENIVKFVMEAIDQDSKGFIDFISYLQHITYFLKLYKAMIESDEVQIRQLEEARQLIRDQLKLNNAHRKF